MAGARQRGRGSLAAPGTCRGRREWMAPALSTHVGVAQHADEVGAQGDTPVAVVLVARQVVLPQPELGHVEALEAAV